MRVHEDELDIDDALVRALVDEQFPEWAGLPLRRAGDGTVNVIYRLGDDLAVRLPRRHAKGATEEQILARLQPELRVRIPRVVARGAASHGYPWTWWVMTWLHGEVPTADLPASDVAGLITSLQEIDASDAPEPAGGRGKPLAHRDPYVRDALTRVAAPGASELWQEAMRAPEWDGQRVWIHCDLDRRNVVVRDGALAGVLDWEGAGAGDPAVDVQAAWKLVAREERARFRSLVGADDATWLRAQGWCVSQALIALGYYMPENNAPIHSEATRWLAEVLAESSDG
jgi:aminoglycoside phosphotransferase (APT) family kinase protein